MTYARHPLSAAWPDMAEEDFTALKDSIAHSGLLEPITLFEGQILDGWHRYSACIETGVEPRFFEFSGDAPAQYVQDKHTRRPLTLTQRLTCIALMSRWRPRGGSQSAGPADCLSSKDMAKAAGGGVRSAEHVKEAITKGAPELVQAMKAGKVGAEKAAAIAKLPKEEQAAAIAKPAPAKKQAAAIAKPIHKKEAPEPQQQEEDEYTELDALADQVRDLQAEVARLKLLVPAEADEGNDMLKEMQHEMATLRQANKAITIARDRFQAENAELNRQCVWLKKQLDKQK